MPIDDPSFPLPAQAQVLWLSFSLRPNIGPAQLSAWHERLFAFLSGRQLTAAVSLQRLVVVPLRRSLGAFDRGMVIGWLLAQAEVTQVCVTARPARLAAPRPAAPARLASGARP
jgi:hypothetical protein